MFILLYIIITTRAIERFLNIARATPRVIDLNEESESSDLTTLVSRETPTLDDREAPLIQALDRARIAHNDAEFDLAVA